MTPDEHRAEAERLVQEAEQNPESTEAYRNTLLAAFVHAFLADRPEQGRYTDAA